jgi:hypothetical protein
MLLRFSGGQAQAFSYQLSAIGQIGSSRYGKELKAES